MISTTAFRTIMDRLRDKFNLTADCEITLEANPGTLNTARLKEFTSAGVNRMSVGVQSLNNDKLRFLGRRHNADDARRLIECATRCGLRVSADFIYGLPGETATDAAKICTDINNLGIEHCSMYELTIEPGTPFGKMNLEMPDNNMMAQMYQVIGDNLALPRYEVSNYAFPGQECRHNQNIWDGAPYIGIGRGAAGRIYDGQRWYEQLGDGAQYEKLDTHIRATEKIITGMRTMRGVKLTPDVAEVLNDDYIAMHPDLLQKADDRIMATKKGLLILDDLLINLVK